MVVTPRTADRQSEKGLADRVDLLIDGIDQQLFLIGRADDFGTHDKEPGRHDVVVPLFLGAEREQIAGQLFGEEPVERLVGVKRVNHVIAKTPGVVVGEVFVRTVGVGITRHVEPVTAPTLSEFGPAQQRIDDFRKRVRRVVSEKRLDVGRGRRNANQVEDDSPQQGWLVGISDRRQPFRLKFSENEAIDVRARPGIVLYSRRPAVR